MKQRRRCCGAVCLACCSTLNSCSSCRRESYLLIIAFISEIRCNGSVFFHSSPAVNFPQLIRSKSSVCCISEVWVVGLLCGGEVVLPSPVAEVSHCVHHLSLAGCAVGSVCCYAVVGGKSVGSAQPLPGALGAVTVALVGVGIPELLERGGYGGALLYGSRSSLRFRFVY